MPEKLLNTKLATKEYRTLSQIKGPLVFVERVADVAYDEMVQIIDPDGNPRVGRVLEIDGDMAIIQMFLGTEGLDISRTGVRFSGDVVRLKVSPSMLGRILNGMGEPIDGGPDIVPEKLEDINGSPINPAVRNEPKEFIQTGVSTIDGLNSLARGQKLPIFSGSGLPGNELAAQIASQARVLSDEKKGDEPFAVVFAAIGITHRESSFFIEHFRSSGALDRTVVFLNHADDPTIERIMTPRAALTTAEYLAYTHDLHVLVILTDMTNYCEALRELSVAREELPGRRGYPGYMYSDLASLYERAGRIKGKKGSVTQLILLSMPDDDITHPIPDLTGYITEGQIVLGRGLHQKGVFPPVDVLPSLSRLMKEAIGKGHTREDHQSVADQIYSFYAEGRELEKLVAIIGEASLTEQDQRILNFSKRFEQEFINQGTENRSIEQTLALAWELLSMFPKEYLKRIPEDMIEKYYKG
ncbi:MAG TPA: V-type ATP synthase subunit B [Anaerolineaceae bacterium]|nr:V-type ATP synthase subunit B [Anaerolineaceae bacterium]